MDTNVMFMRERVNMSFNGVMHLNKSIILLFLKKGLQIVFNLFFWQINQSLINLTDVYEYYVLY